jgi:DNA-binding transcriptional MerR regulator
MELLTISQVSKRFGISTRTLRYYEQIKLIEPVKKEDSAYRNYDEDTILRLRQIIVLRKLRIPLKQIAEILLHGDAAVAIDAFERKLSEIEDEITALSTIRNIIRAFIDKLNLNGAKIALLDDESLLDVVDALTVSKINFKEDKTMDDLNKANERLDKLTDRQVRLVYLPPSTVASAHVIGYNPDGDREGYYPEEKTYEMMRRFVQEAGLHELNPGFRHYGFNHPNGSNHGGMCDDHGYERWVTIPDSLDVSAPMVKKHFPGGLYAAHMIPFGAFEEWGWLWRWVEESEKYDLNLGDSVCMDGLIEEHLNAYGYYKAERSNPEDAESVQLDLLIPVKEK